MSDTVAPNRRILVIDDNASIHEDFRKVLGGAGENPSLDRAKAAFFGASKGAKAAAGAAAAYEVDCADQGQQGAAMAQAARQAGRPYAMAFVDMRMPPGWDGLETIEHLWKFDSELQVVICTAYSDHSLQDITARLGQTDRLLILKKPFDNAEVRQLANAMTEKWRLNRQSSIRTGELERLVEARTTELRRTSLRDRLTGLPNRQVFLEGVAKAIEHNRSAGERFAVLFLDFDHFKAVNDSFGHAVGDQFLLAISDRLTRSVRDTDVVCSPGDESTVARFGGDEFMVLLRNLSRAEDAVAVAQRVLGDLAAPYQLAGHEIHTTASIGLAGSDLGYSRAEDAVREADLAMYAAKAAGRGRVVVFDQEMRAQALLRHELAGELREAIAKSAFQVHYQPIVSLQSGGISGFEALVRWKHPSRGMIPPSFFIPVAEETGLIIPLGELVLQMACRQLAAWRQVEPAAAGLTVSVNLSRRQLAHPALVQSIREALEQGALSPSDLRLEITESSITSDPVAARAVVDRVRSIGVSLQVDDFGVGQSSLSCLHQYPFSGIKIDRTFLSTATERRDYAAVVNAIVSLAHNLGMQVVAEGIELPEQLALLQTMDCDFGQGYLLGRPTDGDATLALIRRPPGFTAAA